jgi:hypothetical protein
MAFKDRLIIAREFEEAVERFCRAVSITVAKNGTEHTHPEFVRQLRTLNDPGAKFVRFAPDGVMLTARGVIHWEAKASKALERDAYETYMRYHAMGCAVRLFVRRPDDGVVFSQLVHQVGFIPSCDVVGQFHPSRRHPIDADDWICPRGGSGYAGAGSGTPYREFDFGSMRVINDFDRVTTEAAA